MASVTAERPARWVRRAPIVAVLLLVAGCGTRSEPDAPLPPDPAQVAMHAAVGDGKEAGFYDATDWRPAWTPDAVAELKRVVAGRRIHALDHVDFDDGTAPAGATPEIADLAHTRAALAYASALARGKTDPVRIYGVYSVPRPDPAAGAALAQALREGKLTAWIEGQAPTDPSYRALSRAYQAQPVAAPPPRDDPASSDGATPAPDTPAPAATGKGPAYHAAAIAVAMERLRWLERAPAATRIDVNIATARMTYWRDGQIADSRVVVVGSPETKTPQLGSPMFRLVANPTWTIPPSIVKKDNMAQRSGRSLARSGMKWVGRRIVQEPGPRNSLGIVKFDLRNGHAIYLHDTPAKGLFAASRRWRSHGCVRVKDASGFATLIATDSGQAERWGELTAGEATASLPLPREIPVRLLYATVLLDEAQAPVFGADPYDWDAPVARRLGFAVPLPVTKPKEGAADSGP